MALERLPKTAVFQAEIKVRIYRTPSLKVLETDVATLSRDLIESFHSDSCLHSENLKAMHISEMITIRFAGWISGRIVSLQPHTDIQKLLSNGNRIRIRISETLLSMFRGFRLFRKLQICCTKLIRIVQNKQVFENQ